GKSQTEGMAGLIMKAKGITMMSEYAKSEARAIEAIQYSAHAYYIRWQHLGPNTGYPIAQPPVVMPPPVMGPQTVVVPPPVMMPPPVYYPPPMVYPAPNVSSTQNLETIDITDQL
ncbi:hypothetical protein TELCIR_16540, partial [Teladorsagia circumcincta]